MDKRLLQRVRGVHGKSPVASSGTTGVDSAAINRLGTNGAMARSALIVITSKAATQSGGTTPSAATLTPTIYEGATSSPATLVTMKSALPAHDALADATSIYHVNLEGMNQYFKVTATPAVTEGGGGSAGTMTFSMAIILGDMDINPEATAATVYEKA